MTVSSPNNSLNTAPNNGSASDTKRSKKNKEWARDGNQLTTLDGQLEKAKMGFTNIIKQNKKRVRFSGGEVSTSSQVVLPGFSSGETSEKPEIVKRVKSPTNSTLLRQPLLINNPTSSVNVNENNSVSKKSLSIDIDNLPVAPKDTDIYDYVKNYLNFEVYEADADGNCMFRAVSHQLFGNEKMHWQIRQRALDFINANKLEYQHFILTDVDAYIHKQRQNASFGDHPELSAISYIYRKRIEIYTVPMVRPTIIEYEEHNDKEPIRLLFKDAHYDSIYDPSREIFSVSDVNTLSQITETKRRPRVKCLEDQIVDACIKESEVEAIDKQIIESELRSTEVSAEEELIAASVLEESRYNYLASVLNNKGDLVKDGNKGSEIEGKKSDNNKNIGNATVKLANDRYNPQTLEDTNKQLPSIPLRKSDDSSIFEPQEASTFPLTNNENQKPVTDFYASALMSAHNIDEDLELQEVLMASMQN
uniref:ubiquitinyl hydrolase 1 n=1 Tax=Strongyloides papillosus TaxID=174720 RepID=A0A0N5BLU6_STREA